MRFLRSGNFADCSFSWAELEPLVRVVEDFTGAEHEFIDSELEAVRKSFLETCKEFIQSLSVNTSRTAHAPHYFAVPQHLEIEAPERFDKAVKEIQFAANRACAAYDDLVRTARKKLAV